MLASRTKPNLRNFAVDLSKLSIRRLHLKPSDVGSSLSHSQVLCSVEVPKFTFAHQQRVTEHLRLLNISRNHVIPPSIRVPLVNVSIEDPTARQEIETPNASILTEITEKPSDVIQDLEMPTNGTAIDKQAMKTTITIRRKKMKKHKLRKLRKRMKFVWAKKRQRIEWNREKEFTDGLIGQIKEAEKFSAADYVAQKLATIQANRSRDL